MTLLGLLQRGRSDQASPGSVLGEAPLQRPTRALAGRREWVHLLPDFPHRDAAGPGRLQPNDLMQRVLDEAVHIIEGHTPAEDAATFRSERFAPQ
jgi:hypothetical protein